MKRLVNYITLIFLVAGVLSGCTTELEPSVNQEGELVLVNLNLTGEVFVEETPYTKAFSSADLIGVQVYQGTDYYAYGLFNDVTKMKIYLRSGSTYRFVCTAVNNGKNIVYFGQGNDSHNGSTLPSYITTENGHYLLKDGDYGLPFMVFNKRYKSDGRWYRDYSGMALNNAFNYDNVRFFDCLQYGSITVYNMSTHQKYPQADRFYGEVSGFTAVGNGSLSIPLKRVGFGLSLSVTGITDGDVTVTIKNSDRTFANYTNITEDKQFGTTNWSFFDLISVWQYADNYAENFTVSVVWNRGVGVTQDLGTKTIQFKRNAVNHVKINLGTSTKSSGLAIELEDPEIINESYEFGN